MKTSTGRRTPSAKKGRRKGVRCGRLVGSRPVSEDRILQLTNDISEGYKTGTKEELRAAVSWWSLKHAEAYGLEKALAHDLVRFALQKANAAQRGARPNK